MKLEDHINAVASLELFKPFSKEELLQLFRSSKSVVKRYQSGQVIYLQNEVCNTMDVILTGRVAVQKIDEQGGVLSIGVFSARETIGANLMFSSRNMYPMTVVAEEETTMLRIYKPLLLKLCQKKVDFMVGLLTTIADKTLVLTDKIEVISLKTIRERLIDFLTYEFHLQKSKVIDLKITKKELAKRLGIQRTSLSRELNKMRKDGLVEYDAQTITLTGLQLDGDFS